MSRFQFESNSFGDLERFLDVDALEGEFRIGGVPSNEALAADHGEQEEDWDEEDDEDWDDDEEEDGEDWDVEDEDEDDFSSKSRSSRAHEDDDEEDERRDRKDKRRGGHGDTDRPRRGRNWFDED